MIKNVLLSTLMNQNALLCTLVTYNVLLIMLRVKNDYSVTVLWKMYPDSLVMMMI